MSTTSNPVPVGKENSILTVLSVSEVAEYLGVGKNRVYELLNTLDQGVKSHKREPIRNG